MPRNRLPADTPAAVRPTEAEVRAFDLETEELGADAATEVPAGDPPESREERIRRAAYERYLQRGGGSGNAVQDWLEAEGMVDRASDPDPMRRKNR